MAVILTPEGFMTVRDPKPPKRTPFVTGGGGGAPSPPPMTTIETPTPSAERLHGTPSQREAQLEAFRKGGETAFQAEVAKARIGDVKPPVEVEKAAEKRRALPMTTREGVVLGAFRLGRREEVPVVLEPKEALGKVK